MEDYNQEANVTTQECEGTINIGYYDEFVFSNKD